MVDRSFLRKGLNKSRTITICTIAIPSKVKNANSLSTTNFSHSNLLSVMTGVVRTSTTNAGGAKYEENLIFIKNLREAVIAKDEEAFQALFEGNEYFLIFVFGCKRKDIQHDMRRVIVSWEFGFDPRFSIPNEITKEACQWLIDKGYGNKKIHFKLEVLEFCEE